MKRIIFSLFVVLFTVASHAAVTVSSIAEIKKLDDGTKFTFSGEAITTMHFRDAGGIFIQDADSNSIFLKHNYLSANNTYFGNPSYNGYKVNCGGTIVKSFSGTFKKATTYGPDKVEFTSAEISKIETGAYDNPVPYIEVAMNDLVANPEKYQYLALKVMANVTKKGSGLYATTYSLDVDSLSLPVYLNSALAGRSVPAAGIFYGMSDNYATGYQFFVLDRYHIQPSAFFNFVDLFNFVDDTNRADVAALEVEILEPMIVNFVAKMPAKTNYYIESTSNGQVAAVCLSVPSRSLNVNIQSGDSIKGVKGFYSKLIFEDDLYKGSMLRLNEASVPAIEVVNSGNEVNWREEKVYNILLSPFNYESRLLSLPVGTFANIAFNEAGQTVNRVAFVQFDSHRRKNDTIRVQMAGGVDMTQYVGIQTAIMGVLDLSEDISGGYPTILLRGEEDIVSDRTFASIGEMIAAGKPFSTKVTYEITNPVLVTYKYYKANNAGGNEHMCGLYLQDATGAILYKTSQPVDGVQPGDSISGLKGRFQYETNVPGHQEHYLIGDANTTFTILNSNNQLQPKGVTLSQIVNNPMEYAASLIKIDNLETTVKFGYSQGSPYETDFLYQNGATMNVVWDELYDNMSVVGVVEYGIMGYGLTIFPITIENTAPKFNGTCRRIKDIKALAAGTEFTYVGNATTTYTDYENGILIQDYTGGILLKNASFGDNGSAAIKSGMVISNIKGIYQPANGDIISSIVIADADINNITIVKEETDVVCRSVDVNVVNTFFEKYLEGEALMMRGVAVRTTDKGHEFVFSYTQNGETVEVKLPLVVKDGVNISSEIFAGYARKFNGVLTFVAVDGNYDVSVDVDAPQVQHDIFYSNQQLFAPEATAISLYDINGRLLLNVETSIVDLSSLNRGIYLVRAIYADGSFQITKVMR